MVKKYTRFVNIALVVSALAVTAACGKFNFFSPSCVGDNCNASASKSSGGSATPTPTPTPTPSPSPSPSPTLNCRIDYLVFDSGPSVLAVDETGTFQLTPWQIDNQTNKPVKVADECNSPKAEMVQWESSSVVGKVTKNLDGFSALTKRVGIGEFTVTAKLDGHQVSRVVR